MSKYGRICGKIKFEIEGFDHELSPKVGDGRNFLKILSKSENSKDDLFDHFVVFITELIIRDVPPVSDKEREELDMFVDRNLITLLNETMISFGLTTRGELERQKKDMLQAVGMGKKS